MTKFTKRLLLFKDISGKKIQADFDGGEVSYDAGLLLLREVERHHRIIRRIAEASRDRRHPSYITHQLEELLKQRAFQIISGYEDTNDCDDLRHDPIVKMACDRLPSSEDDLGSQPTMCRLENAPSRTDLYRLGEAFVDMFIRNGNGCF